MRGRVTRGETCTLCDMPRHAPHSPYCDGCKKERKREQGRAYVERWRHDEGLKEKRRASSRAWRERNPEKAKEQNAKRTKGRPGKKLELILSVFGKAECQECGYDKSVAALQFHHNDPSTKDGAVSGMIHNTRMETAKREAKKCRLLCANCHAEHHAKWDVTDELLTYGTMDKVL